MACVFLLGPKTAFGQSEQNPAYWLQLLLSAKAVGATCTWYDPVKDEVVTRDLKPSDMRLWFRFFMSFMINGVGFHILVHALPIQVAAQSSLTGVVFRAVGMMYLVDLDDTPGYTLTLVEAEEVPEDTNAVQTGETPPQADPTHVDTYSMENKMTETQLSVEAQKILDEAHAKLDALASGKTLPSSTRATGVAGMALGGALALGGAAGTTLATGETRQQKEKGGDLGAGGHSGDGGDGVDGEGDDGGAM